VPIRFDKSCERRTLRLHFTSGDITDAIIVDVADFNDGDGFVYDAMRVKPGQPPYWARFEHLEKYEVLES
jgi:hypothetical protein